MCILDTEAERVFIFYYLIFFKKKNFSVKFAGFRGVCGGQVRAFWFTFDMQKLALAHDSSVGVGGLLLYIN